jgi:hypothetical protein
LPVVRSIPAGEKHGAIVFVLQAWTCLNSVAIR